MHTQDAQLLVIDISQPHSFVRSYVLVVKRVRAKVIHPFCSEEPEEGKMKWPPFLGLLWRFGSMQCVSNL